MALIFTKYECNNPLGRQELLIIANKQNHVKAMAIMEATVTLKVVAIMEATMVMEIMLISINFKK